MTKFYRAPWSALLIVVSIIATSVLIGVSTAFFVSVKGPLRWLDFPITTMALAAFACFIVRGYTVTGDAILVHRLFWDTELPKANLHSATYEPNAMRGSLRLFGNGGFYSITGLYRNRALGVYRAFVTDQKQTVVLRYIGRTIVLSPENPEEFVKSLSAK